MKITLVILTLGLLSPLVYGQQKPTQQVPRGSNIDIAGVKLHLGMSKGDVAERFEGTQITKGSDDISFIGKVGAVLGEVIFKNNRLFYADKSWIDVDDNPVSAADVFNAMFKAVGSLNSQGLSVCKIDRDKVPSPYSDGEAIQEMMDERVWIVCGLKAIRISISKSPNRNTSIDVSETIQTLSTP